MPVEPESVAAEEANAEVERDRDADLLRGLIFATGDWLWETDSEHCCIWVSDNVEDATGVPATELVGNSHINFIKELAETDQGAEAHLEDLLAYRAFSGFEYEVPGGEPGFDRHSISGIPVFVDGVFKGYRGIGRNVSAGLGSAVEEGTETEAAPDETGQNPVTSEAAAEAPEVDASAPASGRDKAFLERVLDSVPAGIVVFDKDDKFVLANKIIRETFPAMAPAMQPGEPLRRSLELAHEAGYLRVSGDEDVDALYDSDGEAWIERYAERYHAGHRVSERCNPDGSWIQAIDTRNDNGIYVGVRLDITERKLREQEAVAATTRFQTAIEALKDGFVVWDADDRLVVCNEAFKRQVPAGMKVETGKTYRELLTDLAWSGAVEDAVDRESKWVQELLDKREEELGQEILFETHDGRWIMRRDQTTATGDRVGIRSDVTDVKKGETALAAARGETERLLADFRTLVDTLDMGVILVGEDLTAEIINTAFYDIWKIRSDEVGEGDPFRALMDNSRANGLHPVDDEEWEGYVARRLSEIRGTDPAPREIVRSDGRTLLFSVTALSGGKRLITYYDITQQKKRQADLEQAQKKAELADRAKSEFLANMSHEIRTPMNGVLGMAELLAKSELDSKQRTFTDIIVKSGNALLTIINDILDFSKIDAGQLQLDPAPFRLAEAIEDVATLVSTRAKEKDLELIVRIQPGLRENMVGDVGRIRQIITNLMGNAVKFTEKGHVLVEVTGEPVGHSTKLKISVADTGIGIPEEQLESIFEKFSQVDASSTRKHEGTGLGLTITSKLVELMGGRIGAESVLGEGSTFWFEIELENSGSQSNRKKAPVDTTGAKVLIIDDNSVNRAILLEQTASWSFDACAAESGEVGLMVLEAAHQKGVRVECVILDYQMPGMTGLEVAAAIRNHQDLSDTPIIMLTSVDQALTTREYRDLGIEAHLVKPARSSQLLETLVETIHAHRGEEAGPEDDVMVQNDDAAEPEEAGATDAAVEKSEPAAIDESKLLDADDTELDILVAEDNEVNQIVFTQILEETGYRYEIVANGKLAVEAAARRKPRMILMDISMPEMNGLEATADIRQAEEGGDRYTPIIGVTAHALKGDRERCLECGMDDYLPKPISPDALQKKIDRWLLKDAMEQPQAV